MKFVTNLLCTAALCGLASPALISPALAQDAAPADDTAGSDIVVTGSRIADTLRTFPGSSTVVDQARLDQQLSVTNDLGSVLAATVPGLAASSNTAANVTQSLRGRPLRVFIDGIPVSNPLRDGGRDLRLISPNAIQSIEVIRGASALYGQGGAGGIINYVTRRGRASDEWKFRTVLSTGFSTQHFKDSLNPAIEQSASGAIGGFDITFDGRYERTNGQFDADGDRIAPDPNNFGGIADSEIYDVFGKIGYNFGDQRIEGMVNYYRQHQNSDYIPVAGNIAAGIKETAIKGELDPRAMDPVNRNFISSLSYFNNSLLGSFHAQGYYLKNYSVFSFNAANFGGTQSVIRSKKLGLQMDFNTPLAMLGLGDGEILWGADVNRDETEQPLIPQTATPGDGRTYTPPLQQMNYAAFIQLEKPLTEWLTLRAGIRHDIFRMKIDDFVAALTNVHVAGGKLRYNATPVNIGATAKISPAVEVFGGFSQGFSIPDIGSPLRRVSATSLDGFHPEPQIVNNYELGLRGTILGSVNYSAAYFISTAKFGTDFVIDPLNPNDAATLRQKERVHGWEISASGKIGAATRWSANYAHTEGRTDADHDGKLDTPLSGRRIGPDQFNLMLEHDLATDWTVSAQYNHSGSRNAFPNSPIGNYYTGRVRPTDRIDLSTRFKVAPFDFSAGVRNLLNADYYSIDSQLLNRNELYSKAEGRTIFIKMGVNY